MECSTRCSVDVGVGCSGRKVGLVGDSGHQDKLWLWFINRTLWFVQLVSVSRKTLPRASLNLGQNSKYCDDPICHINMLLYSQICFEGKDDYLDCVYSIVFRPVYSHPSIFLLHAWPLWTCFTSINEIQNQAHLQLLFFTFYICGWRYENIFLVSYDAFTARNQLVEVMLLALGGIIHYNLDFLPQFCLGRIVHDNLGHNFY